MSPRTYREKRELDSSDGPEGRAASSPSGEGGRFVIQEHAASTQHFDFRLEVDGVLASWAVPKGPSTDPRDRRLALPTEDHPLEYADFEGVIPEDEYGGGAVIVWDSGTYRNLETDDQGEQVPVPRQKKQGHIAVWLEGQKLSGGYALTRTQTGDDERWLLVKMDDDGADARRNPVSTEPESVLSGRTVEQVGEEGDTGTEEADP